MNKNVYSSKVETSLWVRMMTQSILFYSKYNTRVVVFCMRFIKTKYRYDFVDFGDRREKVFKKLIKKM